MSEPAFIPLAEIESYSQITVGKSANQLALLVKAGLPIATTLVIPKQTCQQILLDNKKVIKDFIYAYHSQLEKSIVRIISQNESTTDENIQGDANLVDSIKSFIRKHQPQTLLLQSQNQPLVSGTTFTASLAGEGKSNYLIHAMPGVYIDDVPADTYIVDVRTGVSIENNVAKKETQLVRDRDKLTTKAIFDHDQDQSSLKPKQIKELASLCQRVKQLFLSHQQIFWELTDEGFIVSWLAPIPDDVSINPTSNSTNTAPLVQGICLNEGSIEGKSYIPEVAKPQKTFPETTILVTKQLSSKDLPLLKQVAGIVCESAISDKTVVSFISQHHLPTIIKAPLATKKIRSAQSIILKAGSGQVLPVLTESKATITKVFLSDINQQLKANQDISTNGGVYKPTQGADKSKSYQNLNNELSSFLKASEDFSSNIFYQLGNHDQSSWHLLHHPENTQFHLDIVKAWQKQTLKNCNLIIPVVRSTQELALVINKIKTENFTQHLSLWLELATPMNFHNIEELRRPAIQGFIINPTKLFPHLMNVDPNSNLASTYEFDVEVVRDFYWQALKQVAGKTDLIMDLETYQPQLVTDAVHLHMRGVIVKPELAGSTKERIKFLEKEVLDNGKN